MEENELGLADYWNILKRRKYVFIFFFITIFVSTYIFTKLMAPVYQATMEIKIDKSPDEKTLVNPWTNIPNLTTETKVLKNLSVMRKATERIDVLPMDPKEREHALYIKARGYLTKTKVNQIEDTNIIQIKATSDDPQKAVLFLETLVDVYSEEMIESRKRQGKIVLDLIEKQIVEIKEKIAVTEEKVQIYAQNEKIFDLTDDIRNILGRMEISHTFEFERSLITIEKSLEEINHSLDTKFNNEELSFINDSEFQKSLVFGSLRRRLLELEFNRLLLLIDYTPNHPNILAKNKVINNLRSKLLESLEKHVYERNIDISLLDIAFIVDRFFYNVKKEVHVRLINNFYNDNTLLSPDQISYNRLKRDLERNIGILNNLLDQKREAEVAIVSKVSQIEIVSPAVSSSIPIKPNSNLNYLIGALMGVMIGVIMAFLSESLDTSIVTIEDFEKYFQMNVLGVIPRLNLKLSEMFGGRLRKKDISKNIHALRHSLIVAQSVDSMESEIFIGIRTQLTHLLERSKARSILITSPNQGEGKTFIATNLALSMAQLGKKTLLIDTNLRKPSFHTLFGLNRSPGLTDVIIRRLDWQNVIRSSNDLLVGNALGEEMLKMPGISLLNIITAGLKVPNPSNVLNDPSLFQFIEEAKMYYDVIFLSSPPLLTISDTLAISNKADGVVLVCHAKATKKKELRRSGEFLSSVNANLLGVIINSVNMNSELGSWTNFYRQYAEV